MEPDGCPRQGERKVRKRQQSVLHPERTAQIGDDILGSLLGVATAGTVAHARQFLLDSGIGELRRPNAELAGKEEFLDHVPLSWWQLEVSLEPDLADHQWVTLGGEPEQILDAPIIDVDVQLHGSALDAFRARHGALGRNRRLKKRRVEFVLIFLCLVVFYYVLVVLGVVVLQVCDVEMDLLGLVLELVRNPVMVGFLCVGLVDD